MTYTQLAIVAVALVILLDVFVFRTRLTSKKVFWVSYAIIVSFQFMTNGMFTGLQIVKYRDAAIIGGDSPTQSAPEFIGDGRLFFAPIEDLGFGFSLVLLSLMLWVFFTQRTRDGQTQSGPPRTDLFSRL